MNAISPLAISNFVDKYQLNDPFYSGNKNFQEFATIIREATRFAIGPFFWYVSNYQKLSRPYVSGNIEQLTMFQKTEFQNQSCTTLNQQWHPDDRLYIVAAYDFILSTYLSIPETSRNQIKFNVYGRFLNRNNEFRWVMIQIPYISLTKNNQIESVLNIVYDISHLEIANTPLLSVIDYSNEEVQYFRHIDRNIKRIEVQSCKITKREKDILSLMSQGYNTPQIAKELFISYYTVEKHKRNLRVKTGTKTSSQLIAYSLNYNLLEF